MKKYELQILVDSDPETRYEHWSPVAPRMFSDDLETLMQFMSEYHRIIESETGKEIVRYK